MGEPGVKAAKAECERPVAVQQARIRKAVEIQHGIADCDSDVRFLRPGREDAEGKILNREVRVPVRTTDPASQSRVVGFVDDHCHLGSRAFGKSAQA